MDALEDLEPLLRHIRDICVHDQARWEISWKAVLDDPKTARRGLLLPDLFVQTLEENSVFLPKKTLCALVASFQASNGGVQAARFLKWVKLSRPADHVDPELVFARLPQPYRRIVKILEKDVLDASWELIKQQSARYKAETTAALAATARSTGSRTLNSSVDQSAAAPDPDDYEAAKKRSCKSFVRKDAGDSSTVSCIAQHPWLPLALVAAEDRSSTLGDEAEGSNKVTLQLFNTSSHEMITKHNLLPSQAANPSSDASTAPQTKLKVVSLTPIRVRSAARDDDADAPVCVFGVQVTESMTTPANGDQPESIARRKSVFIYQVHGISILDHSIVISSEQALSFQLAAIGRFESLSWMELSPDGQHLALSTAPGSIAVFEISPAAANADGFSGELTSALDLTTSPPFMKIANDVTLPASNCSMRAHFVVKPSVALSPPSSFQPLDTYAIVVCHEARVLKYILRSSGASGAPATARTLWSHLAAITSSGMDATTQFLAVGLANGSIVIWDTLEEIDRVYLPPSTVDALPLSSPAPTANDPSVDVVVTYRDEFVAAFSAARQQVRFFDIKNRIAPQLLRVVTAPAPSARQRDGVKIVALVETTSVLDVPIAMIGYSNGLLVLHDMRNAEAIGSIRYRSPGSTEVPINLPSVLASQHGISVAQASSIDFFDWRQLLLASFPSFDHLLQQRNLAQDAVNSKRLLLSSSVSPLVVPLPSFSEFSKDAIDRMLRRAAGIPTATSPTRTAAAGTSNAFAYQRQQSKTVLGRLVPSDSSTSIGHQIRAAGSTDEASELPPLPEIALHPSKQSVDVRFHQYCQDLAAATTRDKEAKMHRRRKELIKALTAGAW